MDAATTDEEPKLSRAAKKAAHWQRKQARISGTPNNEATPTGDTYSQPGTYGDADAQPWSGGSGFQDGAWSQDQGGGRQGGATPSWASVAPRSDTPLTEAERAAKTEAKKLAKLARRAERKEAGVTPPEEAGAGVQEPKEELTAEVGPAEKAARRAAKKAAQRIRREREEHAEWAINHKAQKMFGHLGLKPLVVTPARASAHPFEADASDHAETPFEAYRDIEPILFRLATQLGTTKAKLRIYDPFYCEGSVVAHLNRLGFETVHNENEDFYDVVKKGKVPEYDVLVTNPPFSADHMMKTLNFCASTGKPWLLLIPAFVSAKPYYKKYLEAIEETEEVAPVFLVPNNKYTFSAPGRDASGENPLTEAARAASAADDNRPFTIFASKFGCVWFVQLGDHSEGTMGWWQKKFQGAARCRLVEELDMMREIVADPKVNVPKPWRKKLNRQRKAELKKST